jgi:hypothetical protein
VRQNAFKYRDELFDYLNVNNDRKLLTNEDGGGSGKGAAAGAGAGAGSSANAKTGGGRTVHVPAPPEAAADMESEGVDEQIEEEESAKTEL